MSEEGTPRTAENEQSNEDAPENENENTETTETETNEQSNEDVIQDRSASNERPPSREERPPSRGERPSSRGERPPSRNTATLPPLQGATPRNPIEETEAEENETAEFLTILEEHRLECQANGMYAEAMVAQRRLDEFREHERRKRAEAIKARHIAERLDVETAHMQEFEAFNKKWEEKMKKYDEKTELLKESMRTKHAQEVIQWQEEMKAQFMLRPKFSKELLNLRSIQETLAKQRQYEQAQRVQLKADAQQKWELEALKKEWKKKVASKQQMFLQKQALEMDAFQKRIDSGREVQQKISQEKLERILQRYQNIKAELVNQQNLEAIKDMKAKNVAMQIPRPQSKPSFNHSSKNFYLSSSNSKQPKTSRTSRNMSTNRNKAQTSRPSSGGRTYSRERNRIYTDVAQKDFVQLKKYNLHTKLTPQERRQNNARNGNKTRSQGNVRSRANKNVVNEESKSAI